MTAPLSTSHARPKIGLVTCVFLTVAITIGNGIYTSLGLQLLTISHGFTILALWAIGGLCALCGALSYAELASRLPHSGGEYYYLSKIYHPALGTMAGVITLFAGFVAPISLACMAFGKYLHSCFPSCSPLVASMVLISLVTIAHLFNLSFSAFFQDFITGFKFLLITLILYLGFRYASISPRVLLPSVSIWHELFQPSSGVGLLFCFYAYSGWNSITYIADDVDASQRTIGWSLVIGTLLVTTIYLLLNVVFLLSAPLEALRGVLDVATVAATHLVGDTGGKIMALLIAGGLVAGVSGMTWIGPRMTQVMGQNLPALFWLNRTSSSNIPWRATLLQYGLVIIVLLTSSFKMLLIATQIPVLFCSLLGVLGIVVLRQREKINALKRIKKNYSRCSTRNEEHRPGVYSDTRGGKHRSDAVMNGNNFFENALAFACPFYPIPPLLFATITMAALLYTIFTDFGESVWGISIIIVGLMLHPIFKTKFNNRKGVSP